MVSGHVYRATSSLVARRAVAAVALGHGRHRRQAEDAAGREAVAGEPVRRVDGAAAAADGGSTIIKA